LAKAESLILILLKEPAMVARKYHAHHVFTVGLILIGLPLLAAPFVAGGESEPSGSEERLRELLTERYNILKQMYTSFQAQLKFGRVDYVEWRRATFTLHHAEAELCTTDAARIKVYEKLVQAIQTQEDLAVRRTNAGQNTERGARRSPARHPPSENRSRTRPTRPIAIQWVQQNPRPLSALPSTASLACGGHRSSL
jgi:hypothetical protein